MMALCLARRASLRLLNQWQRLTKPSILLVLLTGVPSRDAGVLTRAPGALVRGGVRRGAAAVHTHARAADTLPSHYRENRYLF